MTKRATKSLQTWTKIQMKVENKKIFQFKILILIQNITKKY